MEEDIAENEMDDIIKFINGLSFEQYQKDMEIKEALQLIKSKMIKEEEDKQQRMKEEYQQEINQNILLGNKDYNNEQNSKEISNKEQTQDKTNQQTKEDIGVLESNWNNSVRQSSNRLIDQTTRRR